MAMQQQSFSFLKKTAHAVLSEDRVYRYVLYRSLDGEDWDREFQDSSVPQKRRTVCFVMLNPSTADESHNDPTIEKLMKYAALWGFQRLAVVNLFAIRETDSKKLRPLASGRDIVGPDNDLYIQRVTVAADKIVLGWGNEGDILDRGIDVARMLGAIGVQLWCFKKTGTGQPTHPLYQRDAVTLADLVRLGP
jgi:hypothetical protein